jgi:hypothetical protein
MTESEKTESWVPQEDFQVDCEDELDLQQSSSADLSDELDELVISDDDVLDEDDGSSVGKPSPPRGRGLPGDELVISDDDVLDEDDGKVEKKGYKACLLAHNEKRKLHKDTPPMKVIFDKFPNLIKCPKAKHKIMQASSRGRRKLSKT